MVAKIMQLSKLYQSMIFRTFVCNFLMSKVVIHLISFLQYLNSIRATFFSLFTRQMTSILHNHIFVRQTLGHVHCSMLFHKLKYEYDIHYGLCCSAVSIAENILRVISQKVLLIISSSYTSIGWPLSGNLEANKN